MLRRLLPVVATVAMVAAVSAAPSPTSASVAYPPGIFTLRLSQSVVAPSAEVTAIAEGCESGVTIQFSVDGTSIAGTAPCVEQSPGAATFTFNAPAQVGDYTVRAVELSGPERTATASLTVAAAAPAPEAPEAPGGTLPRTGAEIARIATIAAAALALGFGAVSLARRRRVATQHAHPGGPDTG